MISGPQGVGKSTTVNHALQKMEGVVHLTLTTGTLEEFDLLIRMKEWNSDEPLTRFIIILAISRAALSIPMDLDELRVQALTMKDPPDSVIEKSLTIT